MDARLRKLGIERDVDAMGFGSVEASRFRPGCESLTVGCTSVEGTSMDEKGTWVGALVVTSGNGIDQTGLIC